MKNFTKTEKETALHYYNQFVGNSNPLCKKINKEFQRFTENKLEFLSFVSTNSGNTCTFVLKNDKPVYFTGMCENSLTISFIRVN